MWFLLLIPVGLSLYSKMANGSFNPLVMLPAFSPPINSLPANPLLPHIQIVHPMQNVLPSGVVFTANIDGLFLGASATTEPITGGILTVVSTGNGIHPPSGLMLEGRVSDPKFPGRNDIVLIPEERVLQTL